MNNNIIDKGFLTRLKGIYQAKYGIEMDEWSAMVLYEISENFEENNKVTENTIKEIEKASKLIIGQIKPIHFSDEGQAFYYSLGKNLPYAITILVLGILCYVVISTSFEYKELKARIENYANYSAYKTLMQKGIVEEQKGYLYLILDKHKENVDSVKIGKEFFISKDKETVWIPLGRTQE